MFKRKKVEPVLKLYTIVRSDLAPGYQLAQSVHAVEELANDRSELYLEWKKTSNTVICLSIETEQKLIDMYLDLLRKYVNVKIFVEPDIGNQFTSISFIMKTKEAKKIDLPLALIQYQNLSLIQGKAEWK